MWRPSRELRTGPEEKKRREPKRRSKSKTATRGCGEISNGPGPCLHATAVVVPHATQPESVRAELLCVFFFLGATPTSVENKSLYNRSSCFHRSQLVPPTPAVKALAGRQPSWRFPPSAAPSNLRSPPEKPAALVVPDPRRRRLHSGKCCLWLRAAGDRSVAHPRITIRARGNK
jgi:hypothetical protein